MSILLPDLTLLLALAPLVFMACFVFTTIGFGGGVLVVPLAALFMGPLDFLPVFAVTEAFTVLRLAHVDRQQVVRGDMIRIIAAAAIGTVIGTTLLINLPVRWLMLGLAGFIVAFLATRLLIRKTHAPIARAWAWPMGGLAGVCSGAFGAGGPPAAIFLNMRRHSLAQARATIAMTGSANLLFRLTAFTLAGLYARPQILVTALWLIPLAYLSIRLAEHWRHRIPDLALLRATYAILGFSAVSLLVRALTMD